MSHEDEQLCKTYEKGGGPSSPCHPGEAVQISSLNSISNRQKSSVSPTLKLRSLVANENNEGSGVDTIGKEISVVGGVTGEGNDELTETALKVSSALPQFQQQLLPQSYLIHHPTPSFNQHNREYTFLSGKSETTGGSHHTTYGLTTSGSGGGGGGGGGAGAVAAITSNNGTPTISSVDGGEKYRDLRRKKDNREKRKDKNVKVYLTEGSCDFKLDEVLQSFGEKVEKSKGGKKANKAGTGNLGGVDEQTIEGSVSKRSQKRSNNDKSSPKGVRKEIVAEKGAGNSRSDGLQQDDGSSTSAGAMGSTLSSRRDRSADPTLSSVHDNPQIQELIGNNRSNNVVVVVHCDLNKQSSKSTENLNAAFTKVVTKKQKWKKKTSSSIEDGGSSRHSARGTNQDSFRSRQNLRHKSVAEPTTHQEGLTRNASFTGVSSTFSNLNGCLSNSSSSHHSDASLNGGGKYSTNSSSQGQIPPNAANNSTLPPPCTAQDDTCIVSGSGGVGSGIHSSSSVLSLSEATSLVTDLDLATDFPPLGLENSTSNSSTNGIISIGGASEDNSSVSGSISVVPPPKAVVWPIVRPPSSLSSDPPAVIESSNNVVNAAATVSNSDETVVCSTSYSSVPNNPSILSSNSANIVNDAGNTLATTPSSFSYSSAVAGMIPLQLHQISKADEQQRKASPSSHHPEVCMVPTNSTCDPKPIPFSKISDGVTVIEQTTMVDDNQGDDYATIPCRKESNHMADEDERDRQENESTNPTHVFIDDDNNVALVLNEKAYNSLNVDGVQQLAPVTIIGRSEDSFQDWCSNVGLGLSFGGPVNEELLMDVGGNFDEEDKLAAKPFTPDESATPHSMDTAILCFGLTSEDQQLPSGGFGTEIAEGDGPEELSDPPELSASAAQVTGGEDEDDEELVLHSSGKAERGRTGGIVGDLDDVTVSPESGISSASPLSWQTPNDTGVNGGGGVSRGEASSGKNLEGGTGREWSLIPTPALTDDAKWVPASASDSVDSPIITKASSSPMRYNYNEILNYVVGRWKQVEEELRQQGQLSPGGNNVKYYNNSTLGEAGGGKKA